MICPDCASTNVVIQDDSFDYECHGFKGTNVIRYPICNDCGFDDEKNKYSPEDWDIEN